ncbi:hypothetical protein EU524_01130 [Candidatus Thorarchaeota archaeon]|nr:MAG: hypothetical protein EU524_01130 [Candidatus Thorarchaeota archaeon]
MRAFRKGKKTSRLIPKNHFCSNGLFRQKPLINWHYTKTVLFTAYDIYRSNDIWIDRTINAGMTLKEGLVDLGFPKRVSLLADTGIFELEAKKAGIARDLGIEVDLELTMEQILEAYRISGANQFVAPDEIILATDPLDTVKTKIHTIKQNLLDVLEFIKPSNVMGVVQGIRTPVIDDLLDFYRSNGIRTFALGGVIPLYHHDRNLLAKTITYVRKATKGKWLHMFGLPRAGFIDYYLHEVGADSVDTSLLLYLAARRRYLVGLKARPVREAVFEDCNCDGCAHLSKEMNTRSYGFFLNLYIHNLVTAARFSEKLRVPRKQKDSACEEALVAEKPSEPVSRHQNIQPTPRWETAGELLLRRLCGETESIGEP